jgi:L-seryl-tRNA(Ser) seleniumtransferase
VASGVDIISFSGDKLLGGPQAGIIVGKKKYIEAMKKNQLLRALRVDKLTIAALEGTLVEYLMGNPEDSIPVIHMLKMGREELYRKARVLCDKLQERIGSLERVEDISLLELEDMVGGGAYPTYKLPGFGVKIGFSELHLDNLSRKLRLQNPALLSRRQDGKMLISVRTILDGDEDLLINMLAEVLQKENKRG